MEKNKSKVSTKKKTTTSVSKKTKTEAVRQNASKNNTEVQMLSKACDRLFGCDIKEATSQQMYKSLCSVVQELLATKRKKFHDKYRKNGDKQVYYMSMEFLVGTSLRNNLYNLGVEEEFAKAVEKCGFNIQDMYDMEPDAGLGNGGLGRLASCYLDSMTSVGLPG